MSEALVLPEGARWLDDVRAQPSVVTIGNFDGVHRGHQRLIEQTLQAARTRGARAVVVTFHPHPAAIVRPEAQPPSLSSIPERVALLTAAGIDLVAVVPFDRELSHLEPAEFIRRVLVDRLHAVKVVVGQNFRFGRGASGDVDLLTACGKDHGFDVQALPLQTFKGTPLSSSTVRKALAEGDVATATQVLGRPYQLTGTVVAGEGRGRTIGVPTANLEVAAGRLVPAHGVYAGWASQGQRRWPCVTNVGVRPTFGENAVPSVEAHLIDVEDVDLYGLQLGVTFEIRLRGEQRFEGVDALVSQIRSDIEHARTVLGDVHGTDAAAVDN